MVHGLEPTDKALPGKNRGSQGGIVGDKSPLLRVPTGKSSSAVHHKKGRDTDQGFP